MTAAAVIERLRVRGLTPAVDAICQARGHTLEELFIPDSKTGKPAKFRPIVQARHAILYMVWKTRGWSFPYLGRLFDLDHTTVMSAVKAYRPGPLDDCWQAVGKVGIPVEQVVSTSGQPGASLEPALGLPEVLPLDSGVLPVEPSRALASRALSDQDLLISQSSSLSGTSEASSSCLREQAREGENVKEEPEVVPRSWAELKLEVPHEDMRLMPRPVFEVPADEPKPKKRKATERPIPDSWAPTPQHYIEGKDLGLLKPDVDREAKAFRAHAEAHDRRCVRWDAAFRQWLLKAKPVTVAQRNGRSELPGRHRTRDEAEPHTMTYRELKDDPGATGGPPSGKTLAGMMALIGNGGRT